MSRAMSQEQKFEMMTEAPIPGLIGRLAVPTIISMLITSFYNMADTFFVGKIGTSATAAVGVVFPVMAIIQALGFFCGHGSGNSISRHLGSKDIDLDRDRAELALVKAFAGAGKPILGICRGHQVLNVAFGGTLIQDLGPVGNLFHRPSPGCHWDKIHPIRTLPGSILDTLYGPTLVTNSSHHQAVDRLGDGFTATAWSESGVVEAMEHASLPILAVQFHPERMSYALRRPDANDGAKLFEWFLARCRERAD